MKFRRRDFLKASAAILTSAVVPSVIANTTSTIISSIDPLEELEKKLSADYILDFASPYPTSESHFIPHMHLEFKQAVETATNGRIYVELHDNGVLGTGTELMAAVSRGKIAGALISVSNLSRALPRLDILNIPFWASDNQAYLNLVTSDYWQQYVLNPIRESGHLEVLHHYVIGGRTLTSTKKFNQVVLKPDDLQGLIIRVPASKVLTHFYKMAKANIVEIPWNKVASMAKAGHIELIDPSLVGLYSGPNQLRNHIGAISLLCSVPDAWVNVVSQRWLRTLPTDLQQQIYLAAEQTFQAHLENHSGYQQNCKRYFQQKGIQLLKPEEDMKVQWQDQFGHQNQQWNTIKRTLLGKESIFEKLLEATNIPSRYILN
ncbi:TRAP-type C4-dicarboxylate transport system,periplasmic component [Pseudoalteromonas luteoviolacea B = ATCC 29581]|nr:TRAP-type C4-dicarboxylate transport system,periplasmic component [Pseudoalteromonas luteoviolacea B = ATCC 29581]